MLVPISWRWRRPRPKSVRSWIAISIASRRGAGSAMRVSWRSTQPQLSRREPAPSPLAMALQTRPETQPHLTDGTGRRQQPPAEASPARRPTAQPDAFTDDEILPVFEADLDLPHLPVAALNISKDTSGIEENQ